jgi:GMP synthase (glutamine-hydrolysing)
MPFEAVSYEDSPEKFATATDKKLRKSVKGRALSSVSGGVDSVTSTALVYLAIGNNLHSIHFEHGGMRKGECEHIVNLLNESDMPTKFKDYSSIFMPRVIAAGSDAESKRKAVRETYFDVLVQEAKNLGVNHVVQGTNAADVHEVLEKFVKSQHNVITPKIKERLEREGIEVIEPVKKLFKNEVREVARYLGLPEELTERQAFLGPGLYARVVGQVNEEKMEAVKEADHIATQKLEKLASQLKDFAGKDKQCFAGLMERELIDTRDVYESFPDQIDGFEIKKPRITRNKVTGLSPSGTRTYGRMLIFESYNTEIPDLVKISNTLLENENLKKGNTVRCATVIDESPLGNLIVPLRAVGTVDYKTATALPLKREELEETAGELMDMKEVGLVVYDITHKPPATIEWE